MHFRNISRVGKSGEIGCRYCNPGAVNGVFYCRNTPSLSACPYCHGTHEEGADTVSAIHNARESNETQIYTLHNPDRTPNSGVGLQCDEEAFDDVDERVDGEDCHACHDHQQPASVDPASLGHDRHHISDVALTHDDDIRVPSAGDPCSLADILLSKDCIVVEPNRPLLPELSDPDEEALRREIAEYFVEDLGVQWQSHLHANHTPYTRAEVVDLIAFPPVARPLHELKPDEAQETLVRARRVAYRFLGAMMRRFRTLADQTISLDSRFRAQIHLFRSKVDKIFFHLRSYPLYWRTRNGYVVTTNNLVSACVRGNSNFVPISSRESSRHIIHYLVKYMTKNPVSLQNSAGLLREAQANISKYASTAADSGSIERTKKHLIQRLANSILSPQELSLTQALLCSWGYNNHIGSHRFCYLNMNVYTHAVIKNIRSRESSVSSTVRPGNVPLASSIVSPTAEVLDVISFCSSLLQTHALSGSCRTIDDLLSDITHDYVYRHESLRLLSLLEYACLFSYPRLMSQSAVANSNCATFPVGENHSLYDESFSSVDQPYRVSLRMDVSIPNLCGRTTPLAPNTNSSLNKKMDYAIYMLILHRPFGFRKNLNPGLNGSLADGYSWADYTWSAFTNWRRESMQGTNDTDSSIISKCRIAMLERQGTTLASSPSEQKVLRSFRERSRDLWKDHGTPASPFTTSPIYYKIAHGRLGLSVVANFDKNTYLGIQKETANRESLLAIILRSKKFFRENQDAVDKYTWHYEDFVHRSHSAPQVSMRCRNEPDIYPHSVSNVDAVMAKKFHAFDPADGVMPSLGPGGRGSTPLPMADIDDSDIEAHLHLFDLSKSQTTLATFHIKRLLRAHVRSPMTLPREQQHTTDTFVLDSAQNKTCDRNSQLFSLIHAAAGMGKTYVIDVILSFLENAGVFSARVTFNCVVRVVYVMCSL